MTPSEPAQLAPTTGVETAARPRFAVARRIPPELLVFVVAAVARLGVTLRDGGLHGSYGYDAAVYFAAADALVHGRMPYTDFVLLHPPGLMLFLTPFAALTQVLSDESAFTAAVLAFCLLGALNAVLVVRVCRRLGLGPRASVVGGLFYALWFGAVDAEYLTKLEPLGNLFILCALLAVLRAQERDAPRWSFLAGLPLGLAVNVKIWWIVPVVGILIWHTVHTRRRRAGLALLGGAAAAALVVDLPFFIPDPGAMWTSVIKEQLARHPSSLSPIVRLGDLSTLPRLYGGLSSMQLYAVVFVFVVVVVALAVSAWRVRRARPAVVLLLIQGAILLASPSWFPFYADYLAVAGSITVAAAACPRALAQARFRVGWAGWIATGSAAAITVSILLLGTTAVHPFRGAATLARSVAHIPCVMSDSPMGQIELNSLSRSLANGCRNWIDVTGRTYGPDRGSQTRVRNPLWQKDLRSYLRSGGAVMIVRSTGTGLNQQTKAAISRDGVLARAGGNTVYRVVHSHS